MVRFLNRLRGAWMAWRAGANEVGEPMWNGAGFVATLNPRSMLLELVDARRDIDCSLDAGEPCRHTSDGMFEMMPGQQAAKARRDIRRHGPRPPR